MPVTELDPHHEALRRQYRLYAEKAVAPLVPVDDADATFPAEAALLAAEYGALSIMIPKTYGGVGESNLALSLMIMEVSRICASTSVTLSVHNSLGSGALVDHGSGALKDKYLPRLATGEIFGAYALTEPVSGSDAAALKTTAVRDGDDWLLTGTKLFVTSGDHAGMIVVFARSSQEEKKSRGITAFVVEPGYEGFSIGSKEDKLGIRGSTTVELVLENCRVPAENLLGVEGEGFKIALERLDGGRIGIASQALGIAQRCLEESLSYSQARQQDGKPLSHDQSIQWKLADMATEIDAARLLIYRAARLRDAKAEHTREAAMAKSFAGQLSNRVAREAIQIHGVHGYTKSAAVERCFRDARITELYEGTTEIQKLVIARDLLRNGV